MKYLYIDLKKNGIGEDVINNLKKMFAHNDKYLELPENYGGEIHYVNFLNHSPKGNIYYLDGNYVTKRRIKKGEEIVINYNEDNYCPSCLDFIVQKD